MENITVDGCTLENTQTWSMADGNGDGDYNDSNDYPHNENITYHGGVTKSKITNNTITNGSFIGIDLIGLPPGFQASSGFPSQIKVSGNTINSIYDPRANRQPNAIYTDRPGIKILFEKNKSLEQNTQGIRLGAEPYTGATQIHKYIIARGNTLRNNSPVYLGQGSPGGYETNGKTIRYINNIAFVHNDLKSLSTNNQQSPVSWAHTKNTSVKNNYIADVGTMMYFAINPKDQNKPAVVDNWESNGNQFISPSGDSSFMWGGARTYGSFDAFKNSTGQDINSSIKTSKTSQLAIALTKTTQAGTNSKTVKVSDAKYFYDGWGIEGEVGDRIKIGGQEARVTNVNYDTNTLTIDRSLSWGNNAPVNYYYEGSSPNIGLLPNSFYDGSNVTPIPTPTDDPNATPTPTPNGNNSPTPYVPVNLIQNGDFSDGTSNWSELVYLNLSVKNQVGIIKVEEPKDIIRSEVFNSLIQSNVPIEAGKRYILRFRAKSIASLVLNNKTPSISMIIKKTSSRALFLADPMTFQISDEDQYFSKIFTAKTSDEDASILIQPSGSYTYEIDDVYLSEYKETLQNNDREVSDSCSLFPQGDATCDGVVDSADYSCWRTKFITVLNGGTPSATNDCRVSDFNEDNTVNLLDFVLWKRG